MHGSLRSLVLTMYYGFKNCLSINNMAIEHDWIKDKLLTYIFDCGYECIAN